MLAIPVHTYLPTSLDYELTPVAQSFFSFYPKIHKNIYKIISIYFVLIVYWNGLGEEGAFVPERKDGVLKRNHPHPVSAVRI